MSAALPSLREALFAAAAALPTDAALRTTEAKATRRRLNDRLQRDLLPRTAGAAPVLIVAIAGPNNVGKSSLFNALVGRTLSPARAEGGLTKQCLAAVHPAGWASELKGLLAQRYEVVEVEDAAQAPVDRPGPPGRLYVVQLDTATPRLLLMDTPDFDSVYRDNRQAAEALLVTADLVLFVVSRQTYQNAALVEFLTQAVGTGRPYLLCYNEAARDEQARGHLDKLERDVGQRPVARFVAPHQPEVEAGTSLLQTRPLEGSTGLEVLLSDPSRADALKTLALEASLRAAREELNELARAMAEGGRGPDRLLTRLRHELRGIGVRAALKGVPADVLVEAFRDELDARSTVHRWVRRPFRALAWALTSVGRQVRRSFSGPEAPVSPARVQTELSLRDGLRQTFEALAPEVASWEGDPETSRMLAASIGKEAFAALEKPLTLPELTDERSDREALYAFCRELIGKELPGGQREEWFQALTTLVYSVPAGAAALVTAGAGPFGHDAVIWAGTLLSTPLLEKFVDLLGSQLRGNVTLRWSQEHGATLARALERERFAPLLAHLEAKVAEAAERQERLTRAAAALASAVEVAR